MNQKIPGVLTVAEPKGTTVPAVFDSPHSGTDYPADFNHALDLLTLRQAEDTYVDELYAAAPDCGISFLQAQFPRSYIDANRSVLDFDQSLLCEPWPDPVEQSEKTEGGIGLIWRTASNGQAIYDRLLTVAEARNRISTFHQPYQYKLAELIDRTWQKFGRVYHINCHSMPSISSDNSPEGPGVKRPEFALGDRDGTTCSPAFTEFVRETLAGMGYEVLVNEPYKGVELVRAWSEPTIGKHSLQVEVSRDLYMDEISIEKTPGFSELNENLSKLTKAVSEFAQSAG